MIIESLSLTDFRVFQGLHHFELAPKKRWNASRPIILFGGLNGAGKTTCFYIITGLIAANYGSIFLDGNDISELPMYTDYSCQTHPHDIQGT